GEELAGAGDRGMEERLEREQSRLVRPDQIAAKRLREEDVGDLLEDRLGAGGGAVRFLFQEPEDWLQPRGDTGRSGIEMYNGREKGVHGLGQGVTECESPTQQAGERPGTSMDESGIFVNRVVVQQLVQVASCRCRLVAHDVTVPPRQDNELARRDRDGGSLVEVQPAAAFQD